MILQEIMNKYPITVGKEEQLTEVAKLMVKHNLTAISVVDDNNKLIGIISEGDLLYKKVRPHAPHYINILGANIYYGGIGEYDAQFKKLVATKVEEIMTTEVITAYADAEVEVTVGAMVEKHLKNLPVVDDAYHLVGMVSRHDIMKLIAEEQGK
ncbi:CBS domain-containing protein [Veillonella sp. CHU110]|uniref:CBS domain-containing protein n=1 Tax=Veillonella sp. CHU110 TaxID=2490947 RepID=UPI000F8D5526|nr:CBS domain-containing protein [Veillonella sp. CHU110]